MFPRKKEDAGKPVNYGHNGKFAGRWYCATPGCVMSIADLDHRAGQDYCRGCIDEAAAGTAPEPMEE